jgi:hypothetical protein
MNSEDVNVGGASGDPTIDRSQVGDSFTPLSDQAAMSGNTKDLAWSLVEMRISSGDLPMHDAAASQQREAQDRQGGDGERGQDAEDLPEDPMNVDEYPNVLQGYAAERAGDPVDAERDAEGPKGDAEGFHVMHRAEGFPPHAEGEASGEAEGDAENAQSTPPSGDIPMLEANPDDPVDPKVTDEHADESSLILHGGIPSTPLPQSTHPEEMHHTNVESPRMNAEVVDDTLRDLDRFSPEKDCGATEDSLSLDLYRALSEKAISEVSSDPEDLEVGERGDVEKVGLRKEKQPMQWSFEADLHLGTASVREGLPRKAKGKAPTKTSRQVRDIREQVREHLFREKYYQEPSRNAKYIEAVRQAHEIVYEDYVDSISFTNNFDKNIHQMRTSKDENLARVTVVDAGAQGI